MQSSVLPSNMLSASQWHMKLLRSWQYFLLATGMTLALPLELKVFEIGCLFIVSSRFAIALLGGLLCISAAASMLMAPLLWLSTICRGVARITVTAAWVLSEAKKYTWFALFLMSFALWFIAVASLKGAMGSQLILMTMFVLPAVVALALFYAIILRNIAENASYVSEALRKDDYPHAFGYSCSLNWHPFVLLGVCLLSALLVEGVCYFLGTFLRALVTMSYSADPDPLAAVEALARYNEVVDPLVSALEGSAPRIILAAVKFPAIALAYLKYMRISAEMKGCAVDIVYGNTTEDSSPVCSDLK